MSAGLRELLDDELEAALERVLAPRLTVLLASRQAGHCARVTEAEAPLAVRLCRRLRAAVSNDAQVLVLGVPPQIPAEVAVTSTKLVELRNPDAQGRQRPPLLVFVPPDTHASAEDSFGIATFEEISLGDVYAELAGRLLAELPEELRRRMEEALGEIDDEKWPYASSYARARFLLTIQLNEDDPAAAGAALFELGLIPDFEVFEDPARIRTRIGRNIRQMQTLDHPDRPERLRVIDLGLTDPAFRARLAAFVVETGLEDPYAWTRRIVIDRANWNLSFHRWPLREDKPTGAVRITVGDLDLPRAGYRPEHASHPVLQNLSGQLFLLAGPQGLNQLPVTFDVNPDPRQVAGLARFTVQVVSEDSGQTGVAAHVRLSSTAKSMYKVTLRKLRAAGLEQGWHFIRVLPQDDEGIPLPVEPAHSSSHLDNESDRFFVVTVTDDDDLDDVPSAERPETQAGVSQALRKLEFRAMEEGRDWRAVQCRAVAWKAADGPGRYMLHASFGQHGTAEIQLSPSLVDVQRRTLAEPQRTCRWHLPVTAEQAGEPVPEDGTWPSPTNETIGAFLAARRTALTAIRGSDELIVEGRDLATLRQMAQSYAEAYGEMLAWQLSRAERSDDTQLADLLRELTAMLQIDTVEAAYRDFDGVQRNLVLVSPTHPLRLLWLVAWSELGRHWLESAGDNEASVAAAAGRTLAALTPLGFPLVVPRSGGRLTIAAGDLSPYWGVCLPTDTDDPQDLLAVLSRTLRLPEQWNSGQAVSGRVLADRVERYLRQHPYVSTLVISAVNPGRAEHLADMLVELQGRKGLKHVNYDIRLFAAIPQGAGTGEALAELMRDEWSSAAAAEVFHTRPASGLIPKLAVALRPLSEFRLATDERPSHLTLLFDAFSGESFDAAPGTALGTSPVYGLVQDVVVSYVEDEEVFTWHKQPRHGHAYPIPGAGELSDLLSALPATISAAAAAVTTGQVGIGLTPRVTLSLDARDGTLLHQAHRSSDWVITVDRTLGVEYFDSPGSERRPDYVIDFETAGAEGLGHHLVISSRSVDELRALLAPVIGQHGLQVDPRHAGTFFEQLRLLSGRLAFKLASTAANQRTEVLGLALARLYLDYQGVLADQILLPLDDHLELYRDARRLANEVGEAVNLQRTDLALWSLDAKRRLITCRLVEVKCYSGLHREAAYEQLKAKMTTQLNRSETVIAEHFDPNHIQPDRPDRAVRNAELASLLRFYLGRATRHGTMRADAASEARWLLDHLDARAKFHMRFTRTALVFDLAGRGTSFEAVGGFEYHRIGRDLIEELLEAMPTDPILASDGTSSTVGDLGISLPKLPEAAFRAPARSHEPPEEPVRNEADDLADDSLPETPEQPGPAAPPAVEDTSAETEPERRTAEAAVVTGSVVQGFGTAAPPDIFLGTNRPSPQYGVLGEDALGRTVALDLNETHTISLFGVQGGGKSYTLGSIIEAASLPVPPVNKLPHPLATIVFHYSPTLDYAPEFTSMVAPNDDAEQLRLLRERYGTAPAGLTDVVMLVPEDQLGQRRSEYPSVLVLPLKFGSGELRAEHWRFLMGAVGNQSTYIRQLQRIMKAHRTDLRLDVIRQGVDQSTLSDNLKQLAQQRLDLAAEYIEDTARIKELVRPGRMIIVDLRDEFIEKDEALGLFVVLMQLFAEAQHDGERLNKLVVFDEAHKYIESPDLIDGLVESVREMRHKGMSVLVASQDPPSVPIKLIELSSQVILHKFNSPAWLRHLQKAVVSLADLTSTKMASLAPGEAFVWSSRATDATFTRSAVRVRMRPRVTRHGGATKTAID
jgi:hypothetical protein